MTPLSKLQASEFVPNALDPIADIGGHADMWTDFGRQADIYDLSTGHDICSKPLPRTYQTIVCMDVLEHVFEPQLAAFSIAASMDPSAQLFLTTVSSWPDHKHPVDTFRYMEDGLRYLFRMLTIDRLWSEPDNAGTRITLIAHKEPHNAQDSRS